MRYTFADAAQRDVDGIAAFYAGDDPKAAARFIVEVRRVVTLLLEHPLAGERVDDEYRHYRLTGFPFYVNYRVETGTHSIRVIAISDQRRRPGYWRNRVEEYVPLYRISLAA